ncbi:AcrR family transcriptional regulator [Crossiella equi]|uniref:AcrR family transcriptional regulator n=1 Tax=Crossiella equi TaxID=130796 RepID=A0ABS5AEG2_9PSEU|nr:TetR family transcriptional regulator [Crossiella equi]MBP2474961.1 AcrR family transcriptional regulator [Crossiella equi]
MSVVNEELSLRERKKLRTRTALVDAALALFFDKGFEATTVEEIAAAVEISPRTFFRYFAGKEDVALAQFAEVDELCVTALSARPADEPPVLAVRNAYLVMFEQITAMEGSSQRFRATYQLVVDNPTLSARWGAMSATAEVRAAEQVALRQGVDAETDLRCRLLVRLVCASARLGMELACRRGYRDVGELREVVTEAIDLGTAGLAEAWSTATRRW